MGQAKKMRSVEWKRRQLEASAMKVAKELMAKRREEKEKEKSDESGTPQGD